MMTFPSLGDTPNFPQINGYKIVAQLYESDRTVVYRAIPAEKRGEEGDQSSVVIKILRQEYPTLNEIVQFRNQYTLTHHLTIPGIIRPLSLEPWQKSYILVLEDWGCVSLRQYLKERTLSIGETLAIAWQLAVTLHALHQQQIVHKDVNPANILIDPTTQAIKLTDFGIASLLPRENQELQSLQVLQGTLAYLAPEQTGRMNRGIDYRADFYALGVTVFELLTGQLPFRATEPIELVHCHLAQQPPSVKDLRPDLPLQLSDLVAKLMAKNAEDRYQSAWGLVQDLETCWHQWQAQGEIEPFPLAARDVSDRFLIPEKLYGREVEVQQLLDTFEGVVAGASAFVLVAGFSGIGKTAVVNEVHKPIARQRGYFIKGKFDQFHRDLPFFAFLQASRDLIGQLLAASDEQLAIWKRDLLAALGENTQVMIDVIPELEQIVGSQPPAPELSGVAAQNRFHLLFQKFIQIFATPAHPLVIFLDDLQWVDAASLQLIPLLMDESLAGNVLLIGAYRDNEVSSAHPLRLTLEKIQKSGAKVETLELHPLSANSINQLVADTLHCAPELAHPLSDLVYRKTQGNPFFATQFLKALARSGAIEFQSDLGYWQCDLSQVSDLALNDNVVDLMVRQLQQLPPATQRVLTLAACIGHQFDLHTLAISSAQSDSETAATLWAALAEGLVIPQSEIYKFYWDQNHCEREDVDPRMVKYKFLHDRVQQAAYLLIPPEQKPFTHLTIGRLLWDQPDRVNLLELVNQLNLGRQLIHQSEERQQLAALNLSAGRQAKQSTAYAAAADYFQLAIELFGSDLWFRDYPLAVDLYTNAIEASYLKGDFVEMDLLYSQLQPQVQSDLDLVKAQEILIEALVAQGQLQASVNLGLQVLAQFGIEFPNPPTPQDYGAALERARQAIGDRPPTTLISLPRATAESTIAPLRVLVKLGATVYLAAPHLLPFIPYYGVELSLREGVAPPSTNLFASYGLIHCAFLHDYRTGVEFGQLALNLSLALDDREFRARVLFMHGFFLLHWTQHLRETLPLLQAAYTTGLETGDTAYTGYAAYSCCLHTYFLGQPLPDVFGELDRYRSVLQHLNQVTNLNYHNIYHQIALNLSTRVETPWQFVGSIYNEEVMLPIHLAANDVVALSHVYINKLVIATWFENWDLAVACADLAEPHLGGAAALVTIPIYYFYDSLARIAAGRVQGNLDRVLPRIEENRQKLALWAQSAPMNHQHKLDLVDAELNHALGQRSAAIGWYDRAITGAKENGYLPEEAFANELAAKFYLDWGTETVAASYMQQAYYCYARWGAETKIEHLEREYPQLLVEILQRDRPFLTSQPQIEPTLTKSVISTNGMQTAWFDFPATIAAAQAISQEIELDRLLTTLMQIAIAHAGAESGYLILRQDADWCVVATADRQRAQTLDISLDHCRDLPQSLIYTVAHTQTTAVFDNFSASDLAAQDVYCLIHQPQSVLCTPIARQGKVIGILYLENNLITGAFTHDRLQVLQLLTSQAAISLENARLYQATANYSHTLELEVARKTQALKQKTLDLELALEQLQHTNEKLLRATRLKDEFLANMSHELRTPLNAILGMAEALADEVFGAIDSAQLKAIQTIERSGSHLLELINDILDVAKIESGQIDLNYQHVDVAKLCHASLAFVHPQAQKKRLQLDLKLPHRLPDLLVDERRIRQVLINLLNNAVKFTPEDGSITLKVTHLPGADARCDSLEIAVIDTGIGIAAENIPKLFQPFIQIDSALNRQYQGTGLGLALVKRIVELHGGQVGLSSQVGLGSCFTLSLPCAPNISPVSLSFTPADSQPVVPHSSPESELAASPLILLAEDNEANINMISSYLEAKGYRLLVAYNGSEAIALTQASRPDLILMDIQMPGMDGIEAMKIIRRDSSLSNVPIVALTALVMTGDRDQCLAAGANDYLSKPVKLKELATSIQRLLDHN